ncbi:MAG: Ig-like domain-containing protein [Gemmatimonadaceae bacterium]
MSRGRVIRPAIALCLVVGGLLACDDRGPTGALGIASVSVSAGGANTVAVGATTAYAASARTLNGLLVSGATFEWNSSAPGIATVSTTGVVTGIATGRAAISASAGGFNGIAVITVIPDETPASISLIPSSPVAMVAGTSLTLAATVRARDGHVTNAAVTYTTSDGAIVSVAGSVVTAGKAGTASITATSGTVSVTLPVTVFPGTSSALGVSVQPVGGTAGSPLPVQPVIEVRDKGGNLIDAHQYIVSASIAAGDGTLSGTTTIMTVGGVARFTDLAITGVAGTRTLAFTTTAALTPVTSTDVVIAASPAALLVLDTTAVSIAAFSGTSQSVSVRIRNGGLAPLVGVSADTPVYNAGQRTGWLVASIVGSAAPYSLALQANATIPPGVYRAVVEVNGAGASNSPVSVVVMLTVSEGPFIAYGTNTEKLRILDVGETYTPTFSAVDGVGQPTPSGAVSYVSRATTVATVDAQGKITARGEGQTYVAALGITSADSVFVTVTRSPGGPVLRSDLTTFRAKAGDVMTIDVYVDTRSMQVGAATIAVGYTTAVSAFNSVSITVPTGPPVPVVSSPLGGVYRVSVASATPLTGHVAMLRLRVSTAFQSSSGSITLTVTEIVAPDGTDLLPVTTSTRIPIIVQ